MLVGVDGSAGAQTAVAAAAQLSPTRRLLLVTVDDGQPSDDATDLLHTGEAAVTRLHVPGGRGAPGRAVAGALTRCARRHEAAVIVVGSRGRSAMAEILLGSVAMATLHHAYRQVLVAAPAGRTPPADYPF